MNNQDDRAIRRMGMLQAAATYPGRPRERLLALAEADEICARLYPEQDQEIQAIRIAARILPIRPLAPTPAHELEDHLIGLLRGIVEESLDSGDLRLPEAIAAEQAAVAFWALASVRGAISRRHGDINYSLAAPAAIGTRQMVTLLADSLTWHPLSEEWDYRATRDRVLDYLGTVQRGPTYRGPFKPDTRAGPPSQMDRAASTGAAV